MAHRCAMLAAAAAAGGFLVAAAGPALAADDGYENVFSSVLTAVGLISPDKSPEIDYRERPMLVVPPKTTLAKPQTAAAPANPAWPQDPDVLRRRKEAEESKIPMGQMFGRDGVERISKAEQLKYRALETQQYDPYGCNMSDKNLFHCRVSPDEMKTETDQYRAENPAKADKIDPGVEPPRQYLTQPPKGYMVTTKTVVATHEAPEKRVDDSASMFGHTAKKSSVDPLDN